MKIQKNRRNLLLTAILIALVAAPFLTTNNYQLYILNILGIYILLNISLNISIGYCGQINLAVAALWGFGAYVSTLLTVDLGVNFWIALPLSGLITAVLGGLIGLPSLKVRSHYLAIVTIALAGIINMVLVNEREITRGAIGIMHIPSPKIFGFEISSDFHYYYFILVMTIIGYLFARFIIDHRIGRNFIAVRDDYVAAQAMGVNTAYYQILAFAFSGLYAGIAGSLYAHKINYVSPDIFGFHSMMLILTMTLIGGSGNLNGSVIGAALVILNESLREFEDLQLVLYGTAVVLIVLFFPEGLVGLFDRIRQWLTNRRKKIPVSEGTP
jgi:branched-chain amino acid transport system permease protein